MPESDFHLTGSEAEAIGRLSALENMREQARQGNRKAMLANVEKLIEAELRAIQTARAVRAQEEAAGNPREPRPSNK